MSVEVLPGSTSRDQNFKLMTDLDISLRIMTGRDF